MFSKWGIIPFGFGFRKLCMNATTPFLRTRRRLPQPVSVPIQFGTQHTEESLRQLGIALGEHHAEIARGKAKRGPIFDVHIEGNCRTARIVLTRPSMIWTIIWIALKHGFNPVTEFRGKLAEMPMMIILISWFIQDKDIPVDIANTLDLLS